MKEDFPHYQKGFLEIVKMKKELINKKAVAFDLDGVIYFGNRQANGAAECIKTIREKGKKVFFITNNSACTRQQIVEKLLNMNIYADIDYVITSGYAAVVYLENRKKKNERIFILGTKDLKIELADRIFQNCAPN